MSNGFEVMEVMAGWALPILKVWVAMNRREGYVEVRVDILSSQKVFMVDVTMCFQVSGVGGYYIIEYADGREYNARILLTIDVHENLSVSGNRARSRLMISFSMPSCATMFLKKPSIFLWAIV